MRNFKLFTTFILFAIVLGCSSDNGTIPIPSATNYRLIKTTEGNHIVNYEYDDLGRLSKVHLSTLEYNEDGTLAKIIGDNHLRNYSYNPDGSIKEIIVQNNNSTTKVELNAIMVNNKLVIYRIYQYEETDGVFQLKVTQSNTLDSQNRVTEFVQGGNSYEDYLRGTFIYDPQGNRTSGKLYKKKNNETEYLYAEITYEFNDKINTYKVRYNNALESELITVKDTYYFFGLDMESPNFYTKVSVKSYKESGALDQDQTVGIYGEFNEAGYPVKTIAGNELPTFYEYEKY